MVIALCLTRLVKSVITGRALGRIVPDALRKERYRRACLGSDSAALYGGNSRYL